MVQVTAAQTCAPSTKVGFCLDGAGRLGSRLRPTEAGRIARAHGMVIKRARRPSNAPRIKRRRKSRRGVLVACSGVQVVHTPPRFVNCEQLFRCTAGLRLSTPQSHDCDKHSSYASLREERAGIVRDRAPGVVTHDTQASTGDVPHRPPLVRDASLLLDVDALRHELAHHGRRR